MKAPGLFGPAPSQRLLFSSVAGSFGRLAHHPHILGLRAFLTLCDFELDDLALFQIAKTLTGNAGVMHEHVLAFLGGNKTITLLAIKPLHRTLRHNDFIPPPGLTAPTKWFLLYYGPSVESCTPAPAAVGVAVNRPGAQIAMPSGHRFLEIASATASPMTGQWIT